MKRTRVRSAVAGALGSGLAALVVVGCSGDVREGGVSLAVVPTKSVASEVAAHRAEVELWRRERREALLREDGWLTLVGLHWLADGVNTAGSEPTKDLVFPPNAPRDVGVFHLVDGQVELVAASASGAVHEGRPVERLPMVSDAEGDPTVVEMGTFRFHIVARNGRLGLRVKDSESAVRRGFEGLEAFSIDPAWRIVGRFLPYDEGRTITVPNILGEPTEEPSPGAVELVVEGATHQLDAIEADGELFVVFGDATNGRETYGGGRFLYADLPDSEGRVVVDFNKAYNPPCVFTPHATCPLPPPQNKLPLAIAAGEKKYAGAWH